MSVDSQNDRIIEEFKNILDNDDEEEVKKPKPQNNSPLFKSQPQLNSQQNQYQKPNNSFLQNPNYQQNSNYAQPPPIKKQQSANIQQFSPSYQQNQYQPISKAQQYQQNQNQYPPQNQYQQNKNSQQNNDNYGKQNSMIYKTQGQIPNKPIPSTHSMGRGRSQVKQPTQLWTQSSDLQNRVKNAIEKSMNVIKKFKAIKDNSLN